MSPNSHPPGALQLGQVVDNDDPESRGRVQVHLVALGIEVWCETMAPSAGEDYGVSMLPKLDELVVVGFLGPELPVVLGALWRGSSQQPEPARPVEDNYLIKTPGGSELRMDDSTPSIEIKTQAGYRVLIDEGSGEVKVERESQSITLSSSAIEIRSSGQVTIDASTLSITAGTVNIDAGMTQASGVVQCSTLIANLVNGTSYTPGAGNIW
jgi:uncharacterized protein involved in type VI secretion and phage assembly